VPPTSLTRGPKMSNGPQRRQRGRPEMMRTDSRDMDKLNQQVACSDLFGGGGREEGFQPALPEVERSPSHALYDQSERPVNLGEYRGGLPISPSERSLTADSPRVTTEA
jgi:hypothetical protein